MPPGVERRLSNSDERSSSLPFFKREAAHRSFHKGRGCGELIKCILNFGEPQAQKSNGSVLFGLFLTIYRYFALHEHK